MTSVIAVRLRDLPARWKIREHEGDFSLGITNPNDHEVSEFI